RRVHAFFDLSDEAIAAAMRSLDKAWRSGVIVQGLTDLTNSYFENGFADEGTRPHLVEQFLFGDGLGRPGNEIVEHSKGFGPELYRPGALPQALGCEIQAKGAEVDPSVVSHLVVSEN